MDETGSTQNAFCGKLIRESTRKALLPEDKQHLLVSIGTVSAQSKYLFRTYSPQEIKVEEEEIRELLRVKTANNETLPLRFEFFRTSPSLDDYSSGEWVISDADFTICGLALNCKAKTSTSPESEMVTFRYLPIQDSPTKAQKLEKIDVKVLSRGGIKSYRAIGEYPPFETAKKGVFLSKSASRQVFFILLVSVVLDLPLDCVFCRKILITQIRHGRIFQQKEICHYVYVSPNVTL